MDVEVLIRRETENSRMEQRTNSSQRDRNGRRCPCAKRKGMENRNINNKTNHSLNCAMHIAGHAANKRANCFWGQGCDTAVVSYTRTAHKPRTSSTDMPIAPVDREDG